nr:MAG TPA: hypothetical protein [Caudoviricetes sp.]
MGGLFLFLSQIKQICACFSKLRLLAVCHVRQIRLKCLMVFFGPVLFCLCCFQALDFCLILFFCSMNDFLYSIIPEAKAAILLQISCSAYRGTIFFALFKFHQTANAKIVSRKEGIRFSSRLKDFCALLSLFQKLWSQDPCICARINKASLPHPFRIRRVELCRFIHFACTFFCRATLICNACRSRARNCVECHKDQNHYKKRYCKEEK